MSTLNEMLKAATKAMHDAYAPYSNFRVGACLLSTNNKLYAGGNIENCVYPLGLCAETTALSHMICYGCKQIKEVVIIGSAPAVCTPCGSCRHRIYEFATKDTIFHLYGCHGEHGDYRKVTLGELLPYPFTPETLRSV